MRGLSHFEFKPVEWRCTSQRRQKTTYRRIFGRGAWVVNDVRTSDGVRLALLPLTFSVQTGREDADRFGRLQYSPARMDEIAAHSPLVHVDLNIPDDDVRDLWARD